MDIEKSILKEDLKNVYIVGGNACAGKSTIARKISEEYGIALYQMDMHYDQHRAMANEEEQPNMCYPREDIYAYINRPVMEYADSLQKAVKEEVPMVFKDLMELSKQGPVVADVLFTPSDIEGIIPFERAVFLTSNKELVIKDYFNRPEKKDFCDCIFKFPNPKKSFENVFNVVDLINQREKAIIEKSGYYSLSRTNDSTVDDMFKKVSLHFGLSKPNELHITTERLIVRTFKESDLAEFEKLLNIPEVPGWMAQRHRSRDFLAWQISNYKAMDIVNGVVCLGFFNKNTGEVLGAVGAGEHDDLHEPEIFYNLLPEKRGKGYAVEAARAVTEWALANYNIPYIIGTVEVDNVPSQRVLDRCGYQFINEQTLLVHISNKRYRFKYYRHFRVYPLPWDYCIFSGVPG
jgi:RimJ/RimL family protein N-acetyltransferase